MKGMDTVNHYDYTTECSILVPVNSAASTAGAAS